MYRTDSKVFWAIAENTSRNIRPTAARIAHTAGFSRRSSVYGSLGRLQADGYISDGGRKRNVRWSLTQKGAAFVEQYGTDRDAAPVTDDPTTDETPEVETTESTETEIIHPTFRKLERYLAGGARFIWLTGEAGVGKTYAVEQIAARLGFELFVSTPVLDKYELLGYNDANGNAVQTEIARWAKHDGPAVLLLDEVDGNMAPAMLALNSLLANGIGIFPDGKVRVSSDKVVIATANTTGQGPTIKYCGRQPMDAAFVDRFELQLHWGLHAPTELAIAKHKVSHASVERTVAASWKIRENLEASGIEVDWGPRRTYALCRAVACGFSLREAAIDAGLSRLDSSEVDAALRGVA